MFKCVQATGSLLCTIFWLNLLGRLQWVIIYYVWPTVSMCVLPLAILRLMQLRTQIRKRLTFRKIEIIVDIAGYTTHMLAGVICYTERYHTNSSNSYGLWLFSVSTAIIYALDGWLLMDTLAELRVSRLVPKHTLRLVHFTNTKLWKETRAMYYLFSRLPVERGPPSQTKAIIEAPSLALVLYDERNVRVHISNFLLDEIPREGLQSEPRNPEEIDDLDNIPGTSTRFTNSSATSMNPIKSAKQESRTSTITLVMTKEKHDTSAHSVAKTSNFPLEEVPQESAPPEPEEIDDLENVSGTSTRFTNPSATSIISIISAKQESFKSNSLSDIILVTKSEESDISAISEATSKESQGLHRPQRQ